MATTARDLRWFGSSVKSVEGSRIIQGQAEFLANLDTPGMLHAAFLRSTRAHARITKLDVTKAIQLEGVHAVVAGVELAGSTAPITSSSPLRPGPFFDGAKVPEFHALASEEVNYMGEPLAVVIADDRYIAEDAAAEIEVEYDALPVVVDPEAALAPGSARTFSDWDDNVGFHFEATGGDLEAAFDGAESRVRYRFAMHRSGYPPLEPRVAIADWSPRDGLTVWVNNQRVHITKVALADVLGIPAALVRVIAPQDIGGGFGWKAPIYPEPFVIAYAARRLGRRIKWVQDRAEAQTAGGHERDGITEIEGAFDSDGRVRGLKVRVVHDVGCAKIDQYQYVGPAGAVRLPLPYAMDAYEVSLDCVLTNKAPITVNRPAGRLAVVFAIEHFMDRAARDLGLDSVEIRRRNFPQSRPYRAPTGARVTDDFAGSFETLLEKMDYAGVVAWLERERAERGRHLGVGVASTFDVAFPNPSSRGHSNYNQPFYASARLKIETDGEIVVFAGDSPQGQNRQTTIAQVVADQFGVQPQRVRVLLGDTQTSPFNNHAVHTQTAADIAAGHLRRKVLDIGSYMLTGFQRAVEGFAPEDVCGLSDGYVFVRDDPERRISIRDIARAAYLTPADLPPGTEPMLEVTVVDEVQASNSACSAQACLVEVFPESGEFRILGWWYVGDAGRVMNPTFLEGAIQGSVATGISNAAYEEYRYDGDGQFLSESLTDYLMIGPMEMPTVRVFNHDTPSHLELGYKKVASEGAGAGVPSALVDAIETALLPLDVRITNLPVTPCRIWEAIQDAEGSGESA